MIIEDTDVRSLLIEGLESPAPEVKTVVEKLYTRGKYICTSAERCWKHNSCRHAKPHFTAKSCDNIWNGAGAPVRDLTWRHRHFRQVGYTRYPLQWIYTEGNIGRTMQLGPRERIRCNCVGILGSAKEKKPPKPKEMKLIISVGEVICPAATGTCQDQCSHGVSHKPNKFCKDMFDDEGVSLRCAPTKSRRSLLYGGFELECQRRKNG
jgi:hypothetical protein